MSEEQLLEILDDMQHQIKYLEEEIIKIKEHLCIGYTQPHDVEDFYNQEF